MPSGGSVDAHMRRAARGGLKSFAKALEWDGEPPPEIAYLLGWYNERRARTLRGFAGEPVQFSEILAFKTLYELNVDPFDTWMLTRLDGLWLAAAAKVK